MLSRGQSPSRSETVSRRLALLSAEFSGVRDASNAEPESPVAEVLPFPEEHTRIREKRPSESASGPEPPSGAGSAPESTAPEATVPASTAPEIVAPGRHAARRTSGWIDLSGFRGRVQLAPAHVAVMAVVAAVALAVTTWWVLRDDPGTPVTPPGTGMELVRAEGDEPVPSGAVAPDGTVAGETGADEATTLVVDVAGKVQTPGIVVLPAGSRVVDAIEAAGGPSKGADLTGINQARPLVDGEQIVVGMPAPPGVAASSAAGPEGADGGLINLNSAPATRLEELPGVGPVTAQAIVSWREANGGFRSVDQLLEVDGIGEKTLARIAPNVTL